MRSQLSTALGAAAESGSGLFGKSPDVGDVRQIELRAGEMAQRTRTLAAKPDHLSSSPWSHMAEDENHSPGLLPSDLCME